MTSWDLGQQEEDLENSKFRKRPFTSRATAHPHSLSEDDISCESRNKHGELP